MRLRECCSPGSGGGRCGDADWPEPHTTTYSRESRSSSARTSGSCPSSSRRGAARPPRPGACSGRRTRFCFGMKTNRLRQLLDEGAPSLGTHLLSISPAMVEMVGHTGMFDYVEFLGEY